MTKKAKKSKKQRELETLGTFVNAHGQIYGDRERFLREARSSLINNEKTYPDVQIFCSGRPREPILVHRCILASKSPVFRQVFLEFARKGANQNLYPGFAVKLCLEYDYDTVMSMMDYMYANALQVKLKNLPALVEIALSYGIHYLVDLCLSYAGMKLEKLRNALLTASAETLTNETPIAPSTRHKNTPNPLYLIQTGVSAMRPDFLQMLMSVAPAALRIEHFQSSVLTQLSADAFQLLLSSDDLQIDEFDLVKLFANWYVLHASSQQGENGRKMSNTENQQNTKVLEGLRFYLLSRNELDKLEKELEHCVSPTAFEKAKVFHNTIEAHHDVVLRKRYGTLDREHFEKLKVQ